LWGGGGELYINLHAGSINLHNIGGFARRESLTCEYSLVTMASADGSNAVH